MNITEENRQEIKKNEKAINQALIRELEAKVKYWQGKDFPTWKMWYDELKKRDPGNSLLNYGFSGKPFFGWGGD